MVCAVFSALFALYRVAGHVFGIKSMCFLRLYDSRINTSAIGIPIPSDTILRHIHTPTTFQN